ncbi:MAG: Smr/MutS family protein [Pseudomonadota bacterium]|nr:Smr/MutS family protein [Pseudomonadota bacterium]
MDEKDKKLSEFKKLLDESGINIDEVLSQKGLIKNSILKKEFKPVYLNEEELQQELPDIITGYKNQGVQQNILEKLMKTKRNYNFKEGEIDLHGETVQTAQMKINNHIEKCYKMNINYLLIITGKGSSETLSPLKKLVFIMLKKFLIVEAVCYAKNHGGSGAFYVQIKN